MNSSDVLKEVRSYYNFLSILKIQISLSYVCMYSWVCTCSMLILLFSFRLKRTYGGYDTSYVDYPLQQAKRRYV
jgi:hypothetical protein